MTFIVIIIVIGRKCRGSINPITPFAWVKSRTVCGLREPGSEKQTWERRQPVVD